MKYRLAMLLVLLTTAMAFAGEYDMSFGYFCKCMLFLAFVTPFGWGAMFVIGYLIVTMSSKGMQKVNATDYSELKVEEKEVLTKRGLREAFIEAKKL